MFRFMRRDFIRFWLSQSFSLLGSSMTSYALTIWAFQETQRALVVSLLLLARFLPETLISFFCGALVDRQKKKTILIVFDTLAAAVSLMLLAAHSRGSLTIPLILIGQVGFGIARAFQAPAAATAIGWLVPSDQYARAGGMESFSQYLTMILSPVLAVFLMTTFGLWTVFLIDFASFLLAAIALLWLIQIPEKGKRRSTPAQRPRLSYAQDVRDGYRFLLGSRGLAKLIGFMGLLNFISRLTYENLLAPMVLARSGGDEFALGFLSGIMGFGGLAGAILVTWRSPQRRLLQGIFFSAAFSFLCGDFLLSLGQSLPVWAVGGLLSSVPLPWITACQNALMYRNVPQDLRGRVFAVRNALQFGSIPLGLFFGGVLADGVLEPFMASGTVVAGFLSRLVGSGYGSGMALLFLISGMLGIAASLLGYRSRDIRIWAKD